MFKQGNCTIKARKKLLIEQRSHLAEKIEEMQQTIKRLDIKIDGYEEKVLIKEEELK